MLHTNDDYLMEVGLGALAQFMIHGLALVPIGKSAPCNTMLWDGLMSLQVVRKHKDPYIAVTEILQNADVYGDVKALLMSLLNTAIASLPTPAVRFFYRAKFGETLDLEAISPFETTDEQDLKEQVHLWWAEMTVDHMTVEAETQPASIARNITQSGPYCDDETPETVVTSGIKCESIVYYKEPGEGDSSKLQIDPKLVMYEMAPSRVLSESQEDHIYEEAANSASILPENYATWNIADKNNNTSNSNRDQAVSSYPNPPSVSQPQRQQNVVGYKADKTSVPLSQSRASFSYAGLGLSIHKQLPPLSASNYGDTGNKPSLMASQLLSLLSSTEAAQIDSAMRPLTRSIFDDDEKVEDTSSNTDTWSAYIQRDASARTLQNAELTNSLRASSLDTPHTTHDLAGAVKRGKLGLISTKHDQKTRMPRRSEQPIWVTLDEDKMFLYTDPQRATIPLKIELHTVTRLAETKHQFAQNSNDGFGFQFQYDEDTENDSGARKMAPRFFPTQSSLKLAYNKSEVIFLTCTTAKERDWWMKAILMHKAIGREWNSEFQDTIDEYREALRLGQEDSREDEGHVSLHSKFAILVQEFTATAEVLAQVIIDERFVAPHLRTIAQASMGGIAGGEKYVSHNILFKFSRDHLGLYGNDEFAMKATSHEAKGLTAYMNYSLQTKFPYTLHFPLFSVIDYKGYRMSACCLLPVTGESLVYGSADGGKTIHEKYQEMNALMKKAARELNIKPHWVVSKDQSAPHRCLLAAPGDIEGHRSRTDRRFYVLDTARVFPPQAPTRQRGYLYQLLRPEFVKHHAVPLCSDAFCKWGQDPQDESVIKNHNNEISQATELLTTKIIPAFLHNLNIVMATSINRISRRTGKRKSTQTMNGIAESYRMLVIDMHRWGINVRLMGRIRTLTDNPILKRWLLTEMVARVLKNELRNLLRAQRQEHETADVIICRFLHHMLTDPSGTFWGDDSQQHLYSFSIKERLKTRFPGALPSRKSKPHFNLKRALSMTAVYLRINKLLGIKFSTEIEMKLWAAEQRFFGLQYPDGRVKKPIDLSFDDLTNALLRISPNVTQLPLASFISAESIMLYLGKNLITTLWQKETMLLQAKELYLSALEMKPDDVAILSRLAQVFVELAAIYIAQYNEVEEKVQMFSNETPPSACSTFNPEEQGIGSYVLALKYNEVPVFIAQNLVMITKFMNVESHRLIRLAGIQYEEALRLDPVDWKNHLAYAEYLYKSGNAQLADAHYKQAESINPKEPRIREKYKAFQSVLKQKAPTTASEAAGVPGSPTGTDLKGKTRHRHNKPK
eukprot:TRINITY_DN4566_c0_g1_i12.p1 TRINITY_DN4566_c0_g1~~TRINITY_DN4566_c0_g1_i12.p1  ORF type:complete len:1301 (-),score=219.59 TRINITY_DN4566_c0_g1_i12:10-3912(-)